MDAETEVHLPRLDGEQRLIGAGHGAAGEGDAEGVRRRVGRGHHPLHLVEVRTGLGGRAGDLVDGERAGDPPPLALLLGAGRGDVVGDVDDPGVDALGDQPVGGDPEVQPVTGVVAEAKHDPGPTVGGPGDPVDLLGRRRGEQVTEHGAVGEPGAHDAVVGRVVARTAADDQADLALQRPAGADEPRRTRHPAARTAGRPRRSP